MGLEDLLTFHLNGREKNPYMDQKRVITKEWNRNLFHLKYHQSGSLIVPFPWSVEMHAWKKNRSWMPAQHLKFELPNLFAAFSPHLPVPYIYGSRGPRGLVGLIYWQLGAIGSKYIGNGRSGQYQSQWSFLLNNCNWVYVSNWDHWLLIRNAIPDPAGLPFECRRLCLARAHSKKRKQISFCNNCHGWLMFVLNIMSESCYPKK